MPEALILLAAVAVNVALGVLVVRDVTRQGRSGWWLLAVKFVPGVALPAYVAVRIAAGRAARRGEAPHS